MSRIGNKPITIAEGVDVQVKDNLVLVKGAKGELKEKVFPGLEIKIQDKILTVVNHYPQDKQHRAWHGLLRSLIDNMVVGVSRGWQKQLQLVGVGYRAKIEANKVVLSVGYSHKVVIEIPAGLKVEIDKNTEMKISGISKYKVGQLAANIRAVKPPEPYKGKGIRYKDEVVRRKAGKAGKTGA